MRILHYPQLSMRSYKTGKFILSSDSHFNIIRFKVKETLKADKSIKVDIIVPLHKQIEGYVHELFMFKSLSPQHINRLKCISMDFAYNALANRFHFGYNFMREILVVGKYDIIYNWNPIHTHAFRHIINENKLKTLLVTRIDHLPVQENSSDMFDDRMLMKEVIGMSYGDECLTMLPKVADYLDKRIRKFKGPEVRIDKEVISSEELDSHKTKSLKKFTVFIPNRLTDNKRVKSDILLKAVTRFIENYPTFVDVVITDPTSSGTLVHKDFINTGITTREEYLTWLWKTHCVIYLYDLDWIYSSGVLEAMYTNSVVICKKNSIFPKNYIGFIKDIDVHMLYDKLVDLLCIHEAHKLTEFATLPDEVKSQYCVEVD